MAEELRYEFGRNWAEFVERSFDEERVAIAQTHLLNFLKLPDLHGKTFLDIGCGSGIHSLAAFRAGANRIISFDYDPDSVHTTEKLKQFVGDPPNWTVMQGSVLDSAFVQSLERSDVVYSWGVLHHTGDMWKATENAASRVNPDGVFYIALYTKDVYIDPTPEYWLRIKRHYNEGGFMKKRLMEWAYAWLATIKPQLLARKNPFKEIFDYKKSRGMSYWTDIKDWLGGWPMEFAGLAETKNFCANDLGLELLNIRAGEANTEYLFRKRGARNYWDDYLASQVIEPLSGPFIHDEGHAWVAPLKQHASTADAKEQPQRSRLMLYESGAPMGFAHAPHAHIRAHGNSRYSHWDESLIFSTADNSNPNTNGRRYSICATML